MNRTIKLCILMFFLSVLSLYASTDEPGHSLQEEISPLEDVMMDNDHPLFDSGSIVDDSNNEVLSQELSSNDALASSVDKQGLNKSNLIQNRSYDPDLEYTFGLIPTNDLSINFASHLYLETSMLYGYPTLGGTLDFGINVDTVTIAAYLRYHHFFRPLGSKSGNLYIGEELGEVGLSFKVRIYELGRFNVNIGINTGWYQQWLMYHSSANTYNLVNNGMIIRPEASIGWNWIGWWTMELGLFYQTPLYPTYEGYQGWGLYLKLL